MSTASVRKIQPALSLATETEVTPALAEKWLGKMPKNRHLNATVVATYARDMKSGNWRYTGEAIKFDTAGNLIDGQHRLHAVVSSKSTVKMLVITGLEPDAQDVMDTGRKRGAADALAIGGYPNSSNLAAAAKLCVLYARGEFKTAGQSHMSVVTHAEILEFVLANDDLHDAVSGTVGGSKRVTLPIRPAVSSFCLFTLRRIDADQANAFFSDLANMRTDGTGDPKYALLRRLSVAKQAKERVSPITEAHYVFRAWNALREGEQLVQLKTGNAHGGFEFQMPA